MNTVHDKKQHYFGRDLEAMSFAMNYHKWILDEFEPYLGDSVAEIGAGRGSFSALITKTNIKHLAAFEPSANMYPLLKDHLKDDVRVETINSTLGDKVDIYENRFSSILYINVLEHINDDKKELSDAYKTLRENGHILVFVPALTWLYSEFDKHCGHYRRYCKKGIMSVVQSAGFSVVKVIYFDFAGIIPWYIAFVLLKKAFTSSKVSLYDRWVVPTIRMLESAIPPPAGKNLLLVGRKA